MVLTMIMTKIIDSVLAMIWANGDDGRHCDDDVIDIDGDVLVTVWPPTDNVMANEQAN